MIQDIWKAFKEALEMIFNLAYTPTFIYINGLKKLITNSAIISAIFLAISFTFGMFGIYWPLKISAIIIGLLFITILLTAFPILTLTHFGYEKIPAIRKTVQLYAGIIFWILQLIIYFSIVPIQNAPAAIPLALLLFATVAFGFVAYGFKIGVNPKWAIFRTMFLCCLVTFSFFFPQTHEIIGTVAEKTNEKIMITLKAPKMVEYNPSLHFFNPVTGKARVYYYEFEDNGDIDLFDGPGYHPIFKAPLKPMTPEIARKIKKNYKSPVKNQIKQELEIKTNTISATATPVATAPAQSDLSKTDFKQEPQSSPQIQTKTQEISKPEISESNAKNHYFGPNGKNYAKSFSIGKDLGELTFVSDVKQYLIFHYEGVTCIDNQEDRCASWAGESWTPKSIKALGNYPAPNKPARAILLFSSENQDFMTPTEGALCLVNAGEKVKIFINFPPEVMNHLSGNIYVTIRSSHKIIEVIQ